MQAQNFEPTRWLYVMTNVATGIPYVGETTTEGFKTRKTDGLAVRQSFHLNQLTQGWHPNPLMQADHDKGFTEWTFEWIGRLPDGATKEDAKAAERRIVAKI